MSGAAPRDTDVLVVGGGPIGLAAAIEARLAGLDVTVVEPREGVIDKACGEGLMPGAVSALLRLGVAPRGFALRGVDYRDGQRSAQHRFSAGSGLGVRRTTLHAALLERASSLGVHRVVDRVETLEQGPDSVTAAGIHARWLIGADGLHSEVARLSGLHRATPPARRRYGQRRHYALEPWSDLIEVHWTALGELYVTPNGDDTVGIALLSRRGVRFADALAAAPELAERVRHVEPMSELRGAGPLRQLTRARTAGRVLLVGDASGYVDALTGEGLRIGVAQAHEAVGAIVRGDPRGYESAWREVTRDFRRLTGALVRVADSPARRAVVPLSRALPGLFGGAVERLAR